MEVPATHRASDAGRLRIHERAITFRPESGAPRTHPRDEVTRVTPRLNMLVVRTRDGARSTYAVGAFHGGLGAVYRMHHDAVDLGLAEVLAALRQHGYPIRRAIPPLRSENLLAGGPLRALVALAGQLTVWITLVATAIALAGNVRGTGADRTPRSWTELTVEVVLLILGLAHQVLVVRSDGRETRWLRQYGGAVVTALALTAVALTA